ncbi:MAG: BREX-1 system adenine-specific DNA-methyltransferase PglX [Clostridium sp.]
MYFYWLYTYYTRCNAMIQKNRLLGIITQHSWMFISTFENMRSKCLNHDILNMAHLGARAFEEIGGEVVQTTSFIQRNSFVKNYIGTYSRLVSYTTQYDKEKAFLSKKDIYKAKQSGFYEIPGNPIAYWVSERTLKAFESDHLLKDTVSASVGIQTGDNEKFLHFWWEIFNTEIMFCAKNVQDSYQEKKWFPYNKGGEFRKWSGNDLTVIDWQNDGEHIKENSQLTGHHYQQYADSLKFKPLVTWSRITTGTPAFRLKLAGYLSDMAGFSLYAEEMNLRAVAAYCNSVVAKHYLSFLAPTLNIMVGSVLSMPFDLPVNELNNINGFVDRLMGISKSDWDSFETSWDFQHHPLLCKVSTIAEAFDQWQAECDDRFNHLKANEEELNRIFIDIYGLQDELTPEVEDKDVTVRKADLGRDIRSFISYAVGCMFGRYSLDEDGLAYAGGEWDASKYASFAADKDNIIPICDDEYFEDDIVGLFVEFVKTVYGAETLDENLKFIADALGGKGQPKDVIRNYFLNDFYSDHCKIYQKRPIYWLFDSGKKNGFKALIYMHRYQPDTIARIRTDYVHEQQARYRTAIADLEQRIANASTGERVKLNKKLTTLQAQDTEIRTYEEKIHHLADQMISIDLDDGVKKNYAIFQDVLAKIK